jgi:hypothetical protein
VLWRRLQHSSNFPFPEKEKQIPLITSTIQLTTHAVRHDATATWARKLKVELSVAIQIVAGGCRIARRIPRARR